MELKSDVRGEELQLNTPKIGAEEVRRAMEILKKYKQGKKHLEQRIIDNEQFWKLRHWEQMEKAGEGGNSFDPAADAAFQSYLKRYTREGKAAMADTMAQGAHLTGGYGSTYAQSAAQQAYNGYLARLSDVLPELQEAAYARYRDDGAALLEQYELLHSRDEADYERYLDSLSAWKSERSAAQKLYDEAAAADRKQYQLLLDYFSDKAKAEAKGEATSATTPAAATLGSTLSSTGAESLMKAMTNYLKKGDTAAAKLLYQRYDGRISPAQRTRFKNLFAGYNVELT